MRVFYFTKRKKRTKRKKTLLLSLLLFICLLAQGFLCHAGKKTFFVKGICF